MKGSRMLKVLSDIEADIVQIEDYCTCRNVIAERLEKIGFYLPLLLRGAEQYVRRDSLAILQTEVVRLPALALFVPSQSGATPSCFILVAKTNSAREILMQHSGDLSALFDSANAHLNTLASSYSLTPRERFCLTQVAGGLTSKAIGEQVSISSRGVEFHLHNAIRKLGAKNRTHAVVLALKRGLLGF